MIMDRVGPVGDKNWKFTSYRTNGSIIAVCTLALPSPAAAPATRRRAARSTAWTAAATWSAPTTTSRRGSAPGTGVVSWRGAWQRAPRCSWRAGRRLPEEPAHKPTIAEAWAAAKLPRCRTRR